jgi:hypothetical protein
MPIMRIYNSAVCDLPLRRNNQTVKDYYDATLLYFTIGVYGEAELVEGETIQTVAHQLDNACE